MGGILRDYDLRPPSRGRSLSRFDSYLDTSGYNNTRDEIAPPCGRSSTPSAAVRRAMQVLEETKRQQAMCDRWSRSVDYDRCVNEPSRCRRTPSPIRSRSVSPIRNCGNSPPSWAPSRLVEIERNNFQEALDDSEARREVLLRKLADAQKTMEIQNDRLRDGEMDVSECRATIRLLQQVQKELETKTQFLQKEREACVAKARADAEEKEVQKRKLDDSIRECNRLRCQLDLMLADKKQHHVTLDHMQKSIKDMNGQIKSAKELQTTTSNDLITTREHCKVAKQRCELLEKEKSHVVSELEKTKKKQQVLINRNTELGQRLQRCQTDLQDISENFDKANYELGHNREELAMCRDKTRKQNKDLSDLRRSHSEVLEDRERTLKYNDELEKTLRTMREVNLELKSAKVTCEDDITELHAELAKTRLELTRVADENLLNRNELCDSRKNCKDLTNELLQLRPLVDEMKEKVQEWQGTHKMDVQKMALLEAQKSQLSCEKEDALTRLSALQGSYDELRSHHEEETKKLNKETKELRHEKDKITSQCKDAQAQYARIRDELEATNNHNQSQLDHWRQACSKLTSLVEEKDEDVRECCNQRREAEEACALAEAQKRTLEIQLNDAMTSQEELSRLRMEQKRLSQECAENQQLISVLEMQRDILSKSPSKSSSGESGASKMQLETLQGEVALLKSKLAEAVAEKEEIRRNCAIPDVPGNTEGDIKKLKGMNQVLAEEVTKMKMEVETSQRSLEEKSRIYDRDLREWKREKQQLELRLASMMDEINALKSIQQWKGDEASTEMNRLKTDLEWMRKDLQEKEQELLVIKGELVIVENAKKRAEDRVSILEVSLEEAREAKNKEVTAEQRREKATADRRIKDAKLEASEAENEVLRMQAQELQSVKSSQTVLIEALKKQLEKNGTSGDSDSSGNQSNASKEMKSVKRELQKTAEELASKEKQLIDLKRKFVESQRMEQKARQERDELQGKTIIMESMNNSSQDLLKELEEIRLEKSNLEKHLNNFLTSKTSQTPPTSFALVDDLDRELEKQYRTVCERNKWLEARIASLQREIDLLRDQNSLALEQKNSAEREALRIREELKNLQMASKGSRRQSEVELIHLQHSNAEKQEKILELERELSEKKQLIRAMTKEMESLQKKSEKGKISSFMKKLRRSSDSGSRDVSRTIDFSSDGGTMQSGFGSGGFDTGYGTSSMTHSRQRRANSLSPQPKSSSFGVLPKVNSSLQKSPKSNMIPQIPLSPTLTFVTAIDTGTEEQTPSTGKRFRKQSRDGKSPGPRVSFDENSDHDSPEDSPSTKTGSHSHVSSSPKHDSARGEDEAFFAADYLGEDSHLPVMQTSNERLSKPPSPDCHEPHPALLGGLPSPTSSPSLPSPSGARMRDMAVYVVAASDDSEKDSGSEEVEEIGRNSGGYPSPIKVLPQISLMSPSTSSHNQQKFPPTRPQSQPTFKDATLAPVTLQTRKKHSSLV